MMPAGISAQRAFSESADGKDGLARLDALQAKRAQEIDQRNKTLQAQERALQNILNDDQRNQQSKAVEKLRVDTQRFVQDARAELLGLQRDIENAFALKLRPVIAQVAKEKRLDVVLSLDDPALLWADPALDITPDVIKQLAQAQTR